MFVSFFMFFFFLFAFLTPEARSKLKCKKSKWEGIFEALADPIRTRRPFLESPETFRVLFEWHTSLCIFKTKAFWGTKLCSYLNFHSLYNIWRDQLHRISEPEFYEWLFGPKGFGTFENRVPLRRHKNVNWKFLDSFKSFVRSLLVWAGWRWEEKKNICRQVPMSLAPLLYWLCSHNCKTVYYRKRTITRCTKKCACKASKNTLFNC